MLVAAPYARACLSFTSRNMNLRRVATAGVCLAAGYVVYIHGLWEPLRTIVMFALGGCVSLAAVAAHVRVSRARPTDTGYLQIALLAGAIVSWEAASLTPAFKLVLWAASAAALGGGAALRWEESKRERLKLESRERLINER
jgi:hypothetical protein